MCISPKAGDADLRIKIWEELHNLAAEDILVDVEHVKAHRTKKEKKEMSHSENFDAEGNEKSDELTKKGAMPDEVYGGSKSKNSAAGARRGVCSLAVCGQLSLLS